MGFFIKKHPIYYSMKVQFLSTQLLSLNTENDQPTLLRVSMYTGAGR